MFRSLASFVVALGALACLSNGCASAPRAAATSEPNPASLYPMAQGSAWSYDVDTGEGSSVLAIARVTEVAGTHVTVQGGEGATRYELRPDGIFREERSGYLLKAPVRLEASWPSGSGMQARVRRVGVALDVPAGHFEGCIEIEEQGSASGANVVTTYCPQVGPVQVISSMQLELADRTVQVVAKLRAYQIGAAPK